VCDLLVDLKLQVWTICSYYEFVLECQEKLLKSAKSLSRGMLHASIKRGLHPYLKLVGLLLLLLLPPLLLLLLLLLITHLLYDRENNYMYDECEYVTLYSSAN